ncbi:MAG TPA: RNA polymerase subunit sigma-24 [Opitutae bacterium]|nr:RNA polymerase subunit sigma-24 [Opitutae bacterium]
MGFLKTATVAAPASTEKVSDRDADLALVHRVQSGDVAAFDVLVRKYRERLYAIIYNLTSNREDAADLTQDAFVKAFQSIRRFRGKSAFFTWLYRIGINTTLNYLKKNKRSRFFSFETLQTDVSETECMEAFADKIQADKPVLIKELQEKLNESLQMLSIKHRTALILFEIEGLSHQEIASIMKCSEGTVRSRLHYAKQQLQSLLKDYIQ